MCDSSNCRSVRCSCALLLPCLLYTSNDQWVFNVEYRAYSEGTLQRGRTQVKGENAELRAEGTPINDWWTDVPKITSPTDPEKLDYSTQKSEALLSRIVKMLSLIHISLTLICDYEKSKFYVVSVATDTLAQIEVPADIDWAMLVAYHRGRMEKINGTDFYNNCLLYTSRCV